MKQILVLFLTLTLTTGVLMQTANAQVTVTGSTGANATYATLKAAFDAINTNTNQSGNNIIITITANTTEPATASLTGQATNAWATLTIYPTVSGLSISGNINNAPLIDVYGATHVTFDGRVNTSGSTIDLTISNHSANANGTATIKFQNDASNNTVQYCKITGSSTDNVAGILFLGTASTTGNSNNTIDHNNITNEGGYRPVNAIYSNAQSETALNSSNTISNNNIYDFFNVSAQSWGINISQNSTAWSISGNSFYETTSLAFAGNNGYTVISVNTGTGHTISNNYIGGNSANCGGGAWTNSNSASYTPVFTTIYLNVGTGTASNIQGNTITNFSYTNKKTNAASSWYGINVNAGDVNIGTTSGNTIGSATGTGSILFKEYGTNGSFYGIWNNAAGVADIENNTIGSITVSNQTANNATSFWGIRNFTGSGATTISNNTIGSTSTATSINVSSAASSNVQTAFGIYNAGTGAITISGNTVANINNATSNTTTSKAGIINGIFSGGGTNTISNNTVRDLTIANANNLSTFQASAGGIVLQSTAGAHTVTGNTIYNLSNSYQWFAGNVIGLFYNGSTTASTVSKNFIYGLSVNASSTNANFYGIRIIAGSTTYSNNIINLGGATSTTIYGIYDDGQITGNVNNFYFNSVYIGGTSGTYSYCLYNYSPNDTRDFRNNIFMNARSGGSNYAMYITYDNQPITCDYNDYYASGTGGILGYFWGDKASLPIVTDQDANSLNTNPNFASAGGTSASNYIPSASLPGVSGTGINSDYAGTTRASTPTMGAYELPAAAATWTGTTSTNWNTSTNWSTNSVPTASVNATIPSAPANQPIVNEAPGAPAVCNDLTIASGAALTIAPGKALTVNGTLTNNAGTGSLVIQSDATGTGSLINNTASVNATIQRYVTGSTDISVMKYHLVSVPMTQASNPYSSLFIDSYLYYFDESIPVPANNGWVNMGTSTSNALTVNRGYMIYYQAGSSTTYTFTGPMNNDSFTVLTGYTDATKGFNLVPNPYPSSIDWLASGGWTKTNIDNALYVWNTANYASYVGGVSTNGGSQYIAPGQAFFVHANASSPVLTMGYNVRVHNSVSFLKDKAVIPDLFKIHADAGTASDEIVVRFADGATAGFDGQWDAYKMTGGADAPQLSSVTADGISLAINSLPLGAEPVTVPLDFTFNVTSAVTFTASGMDSFNPATGIYLEDKILGKTVDLRAGPVYTFSYLSSSASDRFVLHFNGLTGVQGNTEAVSGRAFISNGRIYLDVPSMQGQLASITVYNAIGQVIRSQSQMFNGISSIEAPLATGVYIIHLATVSQNFVTKVINK